MAVTSLLLAAPAAVTVWVLEASAGVTFGGLRGRHVLGVCDVFGCRAFGAGHVCGSCVVGVCGVSAVLVLVLANWTAMVSGLGA